MSSLVLKRQTITVAPHLTVTFTLNYLLINLLLLLIYVLTAKTGLTFDAVSGFATLVWAPSGISLAALLILGLKYWPGIFWGAFIANYLTGAPPWVAFGIATGNSLEALLGAYFLKKFGFNLTFDKVKDALLFIFIAVVFSTLTSATVGTTSLLFGRVINLSVYFSTWSTWWIGDGLGDLVVTPFILAWVFNPKAKIASVQITELALAFLSLILISLIEFSGVFQIHNQSLPIAYTIIPALIWIALRFGIRETSTAILLVAIITIWGTVNGFGIFARPRLSESLLYLQGFVGVNAFTFLILSALEKERRELEKRKDEFVSIVSHELKTPITAIKGYLSMLKPSLSTSKKELSRAERIDNEVDRLTKLINDLLDFNRIISGKINLDYEPVSMNKLISGVVSDMKLLSKSHRFVFQSKTEVTTLADEYRISQVLINLLSNAVKYSANGTKIVIKLSRSNHLIIVSVRDLGIGIAPKYHKDIFIQYFQTHEQKKDGNSGLGLGLYISSQIIKAHNGQIWVKSKPGKGSTFYFSIPLKKPNMS